MDMIVVSQSLAQLGTHEPSKVRVKTEELPLKTACDPSPMPMTNLFLLPRFPHVRLEVLSSRILFAWRSLFASNCRSEDCREPYPCL